MKKKTTLTTYKQTETAQRQRSATGKVCVHRVCPGATAAICLSVSPAMPVRVLLLQESLDGIGLGSFEGTEAIRSFPFLVSSLF